MPAQGEQPDLEEGSSPRNSPAMASRAACRHSSATGEPTSSRPLHPFKFIPRSLLILTPKRQPGGCRLPAVATLLCEAPLQRGNLVIQEKIGFADEANDGVGPNRKTVVFQPGGIQGPALLILQIAHIQPMGAILFEPARTWCQIGCHLLMPGRKTSDPAWDC